MLKRWWLAFCDFLPLFPSHFYQNLFSLPLCYLYLAQVLIALWVVSSKCGILSWKRRLKGQFHEFIGCFTLPEDPLYPPSIAVGKPSQFELLSSSWPISHSSDHLLDFWGFSYSRPISCPGASLFFLLPTCWYYASHNMGILTSPYLLVSGFFVDILSLSFVVYAACGFCFEI